MKKATIRVERGRIERVPNGRTPLLTLELQDCERVLSCELSKGFEYSGRKTIDWNYEAVIVNEPIARAKAA